MRKIVSQAIELMSTEEIKSNIQNLDNGGFDISNQTTKEQLKAYLVKPIWLSWSGESGTPITIKVIERENKTKWTTIK